LISHSEGRAEQYITVTVHIVNGNYCIVVNSRVLLQRNTIMLINGEKTEERQNSFVGDPEDIVKDL